MLYYCPFYLYYLLLWLLVLLIYPKIDYVLNSSIYNTNSWNVPFLVCYKKVISDGAIKDELDTEMLDYAVENIEYIHEAGARYRFFKQTEHHFIKLCTCPRIQNASFSIATHQKVSKVSIPKRCTPSYYATTRAGHILGFVEIVKVLIVVTYC